MKHYNLLKIKTELEAKYPHPMYKDFIGCLLGIARDMNDKKIDLDTPVGEFMGHTVKNIFDTNGIVPEEINDSTT